MSKKNRSAKRADVAQATNADGKDKSPYVFQREKLKQPLTIHQRHEWRPKQKDFVDRALDKDTRLILCDGLWGSAKSYLAVYCALKLLSDKRVDSILYVRAPVEAGKSIGFLPGTTEDKVNPYAEPLFQKLHELLDDQTIKALEADKRIEVVPPGFMRGQSWNCKAVIVDEAANFDRAMLELILSRIGPFCKVFVIGSRHQSDIGAPEGFTSLFTAFDDEESRTQGIHCFYFNEESDIVRSAFSRFVMRKLGVLKKVEPLGSGGDWRPGSRSP
jgi:phosphate starvation-inducible PhoH-like protein